MNLPTNKTFHDILVNDGAEKVAEILLQMPQSECPVYHRFGPDLYIREVMIPAGTLAIGHYQKCDHLNVFIRGKVLMLNEDGSTALLEAPMMFVGKPGRKIGYIIEDMVWENIYSTPERDIEKLEEIFFDKSNQWIASEEQRLTMARLEREIDRQDYIAMLKETGFTEEIARKQSEDKSDLIDLEILRVQVGNSPIEGKGLFATAPIKAGEIIAPARIGKQRTIAGRYPNHAKSPTAEMQLHNGNILLVALKDLHGNKAGQLGEEITVDYRVSMKVAKEADEFI